MITVQQPQNEKEFEVYYLVRWQTLREPWGQARGTEKDDKEEESIHLMAIENEKVIGVCRLQFNDASISQVRFMGVSEAARGKGVGRILLNEAEKISKEYGRTKLILQARDYAVDFYKNCGYQTTEKTFLLWDTIQHYLMEKAI